MWGNNVLAYFAERAGSYAFYETEVWLKSLPTFIIALGTFIILAILAMRNGRTYCNTICPVGTVLGFISRYSLFRITIDKDKCTGCSLCSRRCKAACIDYKNHRVDLSRCVACMDCIGQCKGNAIAYKLQLPWEKKDTKVSPAASAPASAHETQETRRSFLVGTALALSASALKAQEKKVDGGLAPIIDKKRPVRETPYPAPRSTECTPLCPALYGLPVVCFGLPQPSATPFHRPYQTDATRNELRTRLLPLGMHPLFGSLPHRSHQPDRPCREIVYQDWHRSLDTAELYHPDRRATLRQLCAPLPNGSHPHDSRLRAPRKRHPYSCHQCRTLHRVRGM